MFTVYVIQNEKGKIYIGQTDNFSKRLSQHNNKDFDKRSYTKLQKGLWSLVYKETFSTRREAIKREGQLKSSRGRDFIKKKVLVGR